MMLNRMYDTPIVVIIAAGPLTLRKGRRHRRSIVTPITPDEIMVTANVTSSTPASGRPVRMMS